jgi:hypothetical protein
MNDKIVNYEINENMDGIRIILGEHDRNVDPECLGEEPVKRCYNSITVKAMKIIVHENYEFDDNPSNHNDIAIVKLKVPVNFNNRYKRLMRPVCLPNHSEEKKMDLIGEILDVTGFGEG